MQIILNPEESTDHLKKLIHEAVLAETSKFPANMKPPEGCKWRPKPLSNAEKAEIQQLHDTGRGRAEIAYMLHLPGRQVSGVVQAYVQNRKNVYVTPHPVIDYIEARQAPQVESLQPVKPLIMPEAEKPPIEPTCSSCGKSLGHDKVAIGGKLYCKGCAPKKIPAMQTKRIKPPKSNSAIDSLIIDVSAKKQDPLDIANEINRVFGGTWMPEDVTKRIAELRT